MSEKCLIISGGDRSEIPYCGKGFDYIIACDRGYMYAEENGITPDLIIGDFDSSELPSSKSEIRKFSTIKDDTDTMLAIKEAMLRGYLDITICCALGGRFDHEFANIQSGAYICTNGGRCEIISDNTRLFFFKSSSMSFERKNGWSLSVFSLSDNSYGVSISGCKFNAENVSISNSFPIGVSNVWSDDVAEISCSDGMLLVIESKLRSKEHI